MHLRKHFSCAHISRAALFIMFVLSSDCRAKKVDMQIFSNSCSLMLADKQSIHFLTMSFDKGIKGRSVASFSLINAETMIFVAGNVSSSNTVYSFTVFAVG